MRGGPERLREVERRRRAGLGDGRAGGQVAARRQDGGRHLRRHSGAPPLGRAEVSLTIDNADGALPIEYSEVTISRTLFRSGGSEYAINGSSCRLLDIQDLLSDSGIGREMHVIVGQGQLDAVLRATPEERRGFVEEAAGVLKHRKRKEKAVRKLDAMQGNLTRLADLTSEVRRQLGPLGRQAEVARKAQFIQADVRDARSRLLADDLAQALASLEQDLAGETALREQQARVEAALTAAREALTGLEQQAAAASPAVTEANDTYYRLSALRERLRGTQTLAAERLRLLGSAEPLQRGADPDDLDAQAERARDAERELTSEVELARAGLEEAVEARAGAEDAATAAERALAALQRASADRREGLARLSGQVAAQRSRVEATQAELGRIREAVAEAERRGAEAGARFTELEARVVGDEAGEVDLDTEHEEAAGALEAAVARVAGLKEQAADAERDRTQWSARVEALELSLDRKDGAGALLADDQPGTLGSVAATLAVEPGFEDAVAAALGPLADAVAVESLDAAVDALRWLREQDAGRATLVVGEPGAAGPSRPGGVTLPDGARWATEAVTAAPSARAGLDALLADVVVVPDLAHGRALVAAHPAVRVVTLGGDLLAGAHAAGGSASSPGVLHLQAALEEGRHALEVAVAAGERARFELAGATQAEESARARHDETLARLNESDARLAAVAEELGHLGATARAARAEAERAGDRLATAEASLVEQEEALEALTARLEAAQLAPEESEDAIEAATEEQDARAQAATAARQQETEARLALRTSEERARALAGRAQSLARAAAAEREARRVAAERERARAVQAARAQAVVTGAGLALAAVERAVAQAADERAAAEAARAEREVGLVSARADVEKLVGELRDLTDVAHRDEVARAQQQLRVEQLQQRAVDELGVDPEVLVDEFGPHRSVPVLDAAPDDDPDAPPREVPFDRAEQEKRLRTAERRLGQLGRVNPLALEEFAALEERHTFLTEQLADLKKSRADLLEIVKEIDERVERVFAEAYADTAAQFEQVFPRLFPGGEGRLVLTDPSDMLATGIEVEARPAGKKVKRLSLLSGGERSLTAVALLVSIFKARPSPFYVMDEVEAALDDTNLGRLLEIFAELQRDSQLIVITHHKRTMEIADALYGVTMRGDGVTTVISQRLRSEEPVGA
ncbi:chromosome partition protein Smc [Luteimicrobium album]|uniref:Chromosome partition protein Smc n=1 Tax=Luteimicrobium album TaxID=1054550 RepID=A0ABQ6I972_9MICO|nr:chromosome segregation protein SMC [Luteimicrobium album]GMA26513.1 chromosome partition protein Smc [Luteimicrobium album]